VIHRQDSLKGELAMTDPMESPTRATFTDGELAETELDAVAGGCDAEAAADQFFFGN
jgi:hypothetical protein